MSLFFPLIFVNGKDGGRICVLYQSSILDSSSPTSHFFAFHIRGYFWNCYLSNFCVCVLKIVTIESGARVWSGRASEKNGKKNAKKKEI